jgi:hypothetical protein
LIQETFDIGDYYAPDSRWWLGEGWSAEPSENGRALRAFNTSDAFTFVNPPLANVAVQLRLRMESGAADLYLRTSAIGYYRLRVDVSGVISVERNGETLASDVVPPWLPTEWRTLYFSFIDNILLIGIDQQQIFLLIDNIPLPPGDIGIVPNFTPETDPASHIIWVDDVTIGVPPSMLPTLTPVPTFSSDFTLAPQFDLMQSSTNYWQTEWSSPVTYSHPQGAFWYNANMPLAARPGAVALVLDVQNNSTCEFKPMNGGTTGRQPSVFPSNTSAQLNGIRCFESGYANTNLCESYGYSEAGRPAPMTIDPVRQGDAWATFQMGWNCLGTANVSYRYIVDGSIDPPPTPTPPPPDPGAWVGDGEILISPTGIIPEFARSYRACPNRTTGEQGDATTRLACAVDGFNIVREHLGGTITWTQFAALVMYGEGNEILLGSLNNGQTMLGIPHDEEKREFCWRLTYQRAATPVPVPPDSPTPTPLPPIANWLVGGDQCNVPTSPSVPGVQQDFIYAVWEWIFNECAKQAGFTNYLREGVAYGGECQEEGFANFLQQFNSLYIASEAELQGYANALQIYVPLASAELEQWGGVGRERYNYGVCPCVWGNVQYETPEQAVQANADPERSARRNDGLNGINFGNAFSYFDHGPDAPTEYRYFKVY